jgi:hypothetical protein
MRRWTFICKKKLSLKYSWVFEFLKQHTIYAYQAFFGRRLVLHWPSFNFYLPVSSGSGRIFKYNRKTAGAAIYRINTGRLFLMPFECRKCYISCLRITSRALSITIGYQEEMHIQPIRNKEMLKKQILILKRVKERY